MIKIRAKSQKTPPNYPFGSKKGGFGLKNGPKSGFL